VWLRPLNIISDSHSADGGRYAVLASRLGPLQGPIVSASVLIGVFGIYDLIPMPASPNIYRHTSEGQIVKLHHESGSFLRMDLYTIVKRPCPQSRTWQRQHVETSIQPYTIFA
jgi:hypothetical protein